MLARNAEKSVRARVLIVSKPMTLRDANRAGPPPNDDLEISQILDECIKTELNAQFGAKLKISREKFPIQRYRTHLLRDY